jgi:hypothetical protein
VVAAVAREPAAAGAPAVADAPAAADEPAVVVDEVSGSRSRRL